MKTVILHKILSHMWGKKVLYEYKSGEPVSNNSIVHIAVLSAADWPPFSSV